MDAYLKCLKEKALVDCKIQISVSPPSVTLTLGLGATGSFNLEVLNVDVYQQNTSGVLPPQRAGGMLEYEIVRANSSVLVGGFGPFTGRLRPGERTTVTVGAKCPTTAQVINTFIDVYSNADRPRVTVPVTINCKSVYLPNQVIFELGYCGAGGTPLIENGVTVGSQQLNCFSLYTRTTVNRSYLLPPPNPGDPYTLVTWWSKCYAADFQRDKCAASESAQANQHLTEAFAAWKLRLKPGIKYEVIKGTVDLKNPRAYPDSYITANIFD